MFVNLTRCEPLAAHHGGANGSSRTDRIGKRLHHGTLLVHA